MTMEKNFSFKKGWKQLPQSAVPEVRSKIISALELKTIPSFYPRLNGRIEPKISEARKIEAVFAEYGITDIWGN